MKVGGCGVAMISYNCIQMLNISNTPLKNFQVVTKKMVGYITKELTFVFEGTDLSINRFEIR